MIGVIRVGVTAGEVTVVVVEEELMVVIAVAAVKGWVSRDRKKVACSTNFR